MKGKLAEDVAVLEIIVNNIQTTGVLIKLTVIIITMIILDKMHQLTKQW